MLWHDGEVALRNLYARQAIVCIPQLERDVVLNLLFDARRKLFDPAHLPLFGRAERFHGFRFQPDPANIARAQKGRVANESDTIAGLQTEELIEAIDLSLQFEETQINAAAEEQRGRGERDRGNLAEVYSFSEHGG